jgi:PAS domain S-box-containing protein
MVRGWVSHQPSERKVPSPMSATHDQPDTMVPPDALMWLIDASSDAIAVRGLDDLRLVKANRAYADLVGVPLERLSGTTPADLGMRDADGHARWLQGLAERETDEDEIELPSQSGVKRVRVSGRVLDVLSRRCVLTILRHPSEEHGTHQARERDGANLLAADERFRALVEQIPAVVYIDAAEGPETTLYISPQTEPILGFTQSDWMNDPNLLSKHVHPDDHGRWRASVEQWRAGEPTALEYRIVGRDGRVVWVHDDSVPIRDASGRPMVWQGVMFDITERKEAEEALLEALERERTAKARLVALDDMKNTFLAAVSHELRTPLTAILGTALTLERDDLELSKSDGRELLRGLAANARKLHRLLGDLLDLDRLARGIIEPNLHPANLAALVRGVLDEPGVLGDRDVTLDLVDVVVDVDAPKVERIVENLLANAGRHTPPGTPIWVSVRPEAGGVLLVVEDAGPGVPAGSRDSVFEPFHQLGPGTPHSPGVGVGLSLVGRFAELHGGRAWVEERAGGGASFRVFLPHPPARDAVRGRDGEEVAL